MSATFKITLAHKPNADGLYEVWLRITANRQPRYASTGIAVAMKQWNPEGKLEKENWIRTSHRLYARYNADLVEILADAKLLAKHHPTADAAQLKQLFLQRHDTTPAASSTDLDFIAFMKQSLEQVDRRQFKPATYEARAAVINKFAAWRPHLPFELLSEELMQEFENYLRDLPNNPTTRRKNLKTLRLYIKRAIKLKFLSRDNDPLEDYVMPKSRPKRVWLTDAELAAYERVHLPQMQHIARLTYLICFYLHGSRVGAVLRLKWKDRQFGRVYFTMDKGDTDKSVAESAQLTAILDSLRPEEGVSPEAYILPWLDADYDQLSERDQLQCIKKATAKLNKNIKLGADKCGISKKISTHSSRRTLATESDRANGGDLGKVGALLGHKQRSTTEIYVDRYNSTEVDETADKVYKHRAMPLLKAG
ncbi:site-specific integrase [Hymenobacter sp. YC55]|uniref:site-specific integrase n=1 Tax=Hymenobacter sp. YC55 TaxID=3034019 RepID=UPI0023F79ED2|nr:site-specific integrase [Hymenobacter sp. YC55]MDF7810787.1 site-specific integrase [Hymenobacter sp. YC55]